MMKVTRRVCLGSVLVALTCSCVSRDVECTARLKITVINRTQDSVRCYLVDTRPEKYEREQDPITFEHDSVTISPSAAVDNSATYRWVGNRSCFFSLQMYPYWHRVSLLAMANVDTLLDVDLYAWDTAAHYFEFPKDELYTFADTVFIEPRVQPVTALP